MCSTILRLLKFLDCTEQIFISGRCNQKYPEGEDKAWGMILKGELDLAGNIAPATKSAVSTEYMYNEEQQ